MNKLRIVIAGGRGFNDYTFLEDKVNEIIKDIKKEDIVIVSGAAKGADTLGEVFAHSHGIELKRFPAEWDRLGKSAGLIRNITMAKYASINNNGMLIAFWNGKSRGTKHMIETAKKYNMTVHVIDYDYVNKKEGK